VDSPISFLVIVLVVGLSWFTDTAQIGGFRHAESGAVFCVLCWKFEAGDWSILHNVS